MAPVAFSASLPLSSAAPFTGRALDARRAPKSAALAAAPVMSAEADKFMFASQTCEAKRAAASTGVYTVQCTEASGGANVAEMTRNAVLAANFRLRQAAPGVRFADLYETRRAAIINANGSHVDESYIVRFPARASASVAGRAEALRACSRYFPAGEEDAASEYMFRCVDNQYKAKKVVGGVFSTMCADGLVNGDAEVARIAALATEFRAKQFSTSQKTQQRYDAIKEAVILARGQCSYEEGYFKSYAKMSGAMRYSNGAYAASVNESSMLTGRRVPSVADQLTGENLDAYWPSNKVRPAVTKTKAPWMPEYTKNYAPMSGAAVAYGVSFQSEPFKESPYAGWSPGWKPTSSVVYSD